MNLIEQFGGYEKAKGLTMSQVGLKKHYTDLQQALLQYRREHNIFEVGDKVVLVKADQFSEVYTYEGFRGGEHWFESENDYGFIKLDRIRHATPEEIQAGRRLEVCGG